MPTLAVRLSAFAMTWLPTGTPTPSPSATPSSSPTPTPSPTSGGGGGGGGGKSLCEKLHLGDFQCHGPSALVSGTLDQMAKTFAESEVKLVSYLTSWWVRWPTAAPETDGNGNAIGPVGFIIAHTAWLTWALAVLGLLLAAGRLAWERRGEAARQAISGMFTLAVVTGCSVAVVRLATQAGDSYSTWIINQSLDQHVVNDTKINEQLFQSKMAAIASLSHTTLSTGLVLILSIFAIVSMLIQLVMMIARVAMVALLTGAFQVTAAMSGTSQGRAAMQKTQAWLIAFVAYKPAAATIYAFSFAGMGTVARDATTEESAGTAQLVGIVTIILAVLALPALMRFLLPLVAATTTGPGGSASAALASGAVATGARMLGGRQDSGGGGGGGGSGGGGAQSSPAGAVQAGGRPQPGQGGSGSPTGGAPPGQGGSGSPPGGGGGGPSGSPSGGGTSGGGGGGVAIANELKERAVEHSKNAAARIQNSTSGGDEGPRGSQ